MNAGAWDRILRVTLGLLMLAVGWGSDGGGWALALRVFALYPLITGLVGWCSLYVLLLVATRKAARG